MLYGVLPRPDARLLPQVLSPHPAPHPGPRTRPRASAPAPRLALWFSRSGPRIRSSHSCLRTPVSALLPPHPGPHSGPVFRAVHSGLALRPRPAPHILPRALGGGFEGRILEGGFRVPGSSSGPRVLALSSGPHNPVLAPRLLAFRPASASHFDPRTPARTPVLHSGPVFREGRLLRFEPALRSSRTDPRTPPSHPALAPRPRTRPRASAHAPRLALRSRVPGGVPRSRAPTQTCPPHSAPRFGRRILAAAPAPGPPPAFRSAFPPSRPGLVLWAADSGGGSCAPAPHSGSAPRSSHSAPLHLGFALRLLHSGLAPRPRAPAPAFPPRIPGGGFEGRFSGDILERRIPGGVFEGGFPGGVLERRIPGGDFLVRPPRRVSELRILANRQNKVYL